MKAKTAGKFVLGLLAWAIALAIVGYFTNTPINLFVLIVSGLAGVWVWNFYGENL